MKKDRICPKVVINELGLCPHLRDQDECDHAHFHEFEEACVDVNDVCPACVCLTTFITQEEMEV